MIEHPLTPEQEQEMRSRARQVYLFRAHTSQDEIVIVLGGMPLPGGIFGDTVPVEVRRTIAEEERPK